MNSTNEELIALKQTEGLVMARKTLILGCLLVVLQMSVAYALPGYSSGVFMEGLVVQAVSQTRITLSNNEFAVSPLATIQDHRHGEVRDIRLSDVRAGSRVSVRALGTTLIEIFILGE